MGRRVGQPALAARSAAARQGRARVRSGRRRHDPAGRQADRPARAAPDRRARRRQRQPLAHRRVAGVESAGPRGERARGGAVRSSARPALAADVLQRHHRGGARPTRHERARGTEPARRARGANPGAGPRRSARRARARLAARDDAGRRHVRHARAPRVRGGGLRGGGPRRRARRARRARGHAAPARPREHRRRGRRAARGDRDAARRARGRDSPSGHRAFGPA